MFYIKPLVFLAIFFALGFARAKKHCKASLGTRNWPSPLEWRALNNSISGRLLQPSPPAAVCHPDQPTYNETLCGVAFATWWNMDPVLESPNRIAFSNWQNDSCMPWLAAPCTGDGYPVYVINATTPKHVKKGIDFARENEVRLVVKGTGHDWMGRSSAPNSLSIWTHLMRGLDFHDSFRPRGCRKSIDTPAITIAAGMVMQEVNSAAALRNLTVVTGGSATVGVGGYITGGGHGAMGPSYGMAADNVLEFEIVTPEGEIMTINECQNKDLFWAMRGGGGSTFGVITSTTIKAFHSTPIIGYDLTITSLASETFWDGLTYFFSQYPSLSRQGISGYQGIYPKAPNNPAYGTMNGTFILPVHSPANTTESFTAAIGDLILHLNTTYPNAFQFETSVATYAQFYDWWYNPSPGFAGIDIIIGSRLLDEKALTADLSALKAALKVAIPPGGASVNFVAGGKVRDVVPRGGSNALNPAWRKAVIHMTSGVIFDPLDPTEKAKQEDILTDTYVAALRKLAPDTGAYVNEADPHEPGFQHAFWGDNYKRLLKIKRKVDPDDVLWCHPCVGNEKWEVVGNLLCKA